MRTSAPCGRWRRARFFVDRKTVGILDDGMIFAVDINLRIFIDGARAASPVAAAPRAPEKT
jgi:hypothetical protein